MPLLCPKDGRNGLRAAGQKGSLRQLTASSADLLPLRLPKKPGAADPGELIKVVVARKVRPSGWATEARPEAAVRPERARTEASTAEPRGTGTRRRSRVVLRRLQSRHHVLPDDHGRIEWSRRSFQLRSTAGQLRRRAELRVSVIGELRRSMQRDGRERPAEEVLAPPGRDARRGGRAGGPEP